MSISPNFRSLKCNQTFFLDRIKLACLLWNLEQGWLEWSFRSSKDSRFVDINLRDERTVYELFFKIAKAVLVKCCQISIISATQPKRNTTFEP
jgi:hypothetical protein